MEGAERKAAAIYQALTLVNGIDRLPAGDGPSVLIASLVLGS